MITVQTLLVNSLPDVAPEDFFLILSHVTQKDKVSLLAHPDRILTFDEQKHAEALLARRRRHEPVALLVGHKEFYGRDFIVTADTLIPRPETELLVETVLGLCSDIEVTTDQNTTILDVGTGSGNIIISLVKESEERQLLTHVTYIACDISTEALLIAQKNALRYQADCPITFLTSNLLQNIPLPETADSSLIITANLPYLSEKIYHESAHDVRDFEPQNALVSGRDGLDHYRRLLPEVKARAHCFQVCHLYLEISPEQTPLIDPLILAVFPQAIITVQADLSGRDRLVTVTVR